VTNGEFIDILINDAESFLKDQDWFVRNKHMLFNKDHYVGTDVPISREVQAAVLTGFLNHVGSQRCMDLGLNLSGLLKD
jgi:hypothetical protein